MVDWYVDFCTRTYWWKCGCAVIQRFSEFKTKLPVLKTDCCLISWCFLYMLPALMENRNSNSLLPNALITSFILMKQCDEYELEEMWCFFSLQSKMSYINLMNTPLTSEALFRTALVLKSARRSGWWEPISLIFFSYNVFTIFYLSISLCYC